MPRHLPIACSLTASELEERLAQMTLLGRDALVESRIEGTRAQLRFAGGAGVRERVDVVVAAESHCCAFLTMHVCGEPDTVVLTIDAPDGAELALSDIVDAFGSGAAAAGRREDPATASRRRGPAGRGDEFATTGRSTVP